MTDWFGGKRVGGLQEEINRVFTDFGFTPPPGFGAALGALSSQPRVEVEKTKTGYEIEIAFPFETSAEQVQAEFRDGKLVITADRPAAGAGGAKVDIRSAASSGGGAQGGTGASASAAASSSGSGGATSAGGGMMGEGSSGADAGRAGGMMGEGA